jgi:hypothetical protein
MRQELQFGERASRRDNPSISVSSASLTSCACYAPRVSTPPITNHHSLITAFLIDTRAIRNRRNPPRINHLTFSNRHSSRGLTFHQNRASSSDLRRALCLSVGAHHAVRACPAGRPGKHSCRYVGQMLRCVAFSEVRPERPLSGCAKLLLGVQNRGPFRRRRLSAGVSVARGRNSA